MKTSLGLSQWTPATASPAVLVRLFLVVQLAPLVAWRLTMGELHL